MKYTLSLVVLGSCLTAACHSPPAGPASLLACSKVPDPHARVHCYDMQVAAIEAHQGRPPQPAAKSSQPVLASARGGATTDTAAAQFGEEDLPPALRPPVPPSARILLSSIKAMHELTEDQYDIFLANGQVWRQSEGNPLMAFFHVGDRVRIEKGFMGSYRMSTPATGAKNWVRVIRIQ